MQIKNVNNEYADLVTRIIANANNCRVNLKSDI